MPQRPALDAEGILCATEEMLRRHGPAKATVVDVARELGVSHAAVYKHFASKQALREAVTRRWLDRNRDHLAEIATDTGLPPVRRLRAWLHGVLELKRTKVRDDPGLFAAYGILAQAHSRVATDHVADLLAQLARILADGAADGTFQLDDPHRTARAVFTATAKFNHLAHADEWAAPDIGAELDAVCDLLLDGLRDPHRRTDD